MIVPLINYINSILIDVFVSYIVSQLCRSLSAADCTSNEIVTNWYYELYWTYYYSLLDEVDKERWRHTFKTIAKKRLDREQV